MPRGGLLHWAVCIHTDIHTDLHVLCVVGGGGAGEKRYHLTPSTGADPQNTITTQHTVAITQASSAHMHVTKLC